MIKLLKKIYLNSPFFVKRFFANAEAIRRDIYRRSGEYDENFAMIDVSTMLKDYNKRKQIKDINILINHVKKHVPFYQKELKIDKIESLAEFSYLPLVNKKKMMENLNNFVNKQLLKTYWKGSTSGSTGTPFNYYRDRKSLQFEYALYDKFYDYVSGEHSCRKARISGVNIVKANCKKPPFWYFVRTYNQLQCSAYHIDVNTYKSYLNAFKKYDVKLGTGYASAWLFLSQYILDNSVKAPRLKAIVTDSEGLSNQEKLVIEEAFNCSVYQTYGLSEIGMVAVQCKNNHYHIFTDRCYVETVDENGKIIDDEEVGEILVTDLYSYNAPFIRYKTGDTGILKHDDCGCGWETPYIKELYGRIEDYVVTSDGRKVRRLGHIARPARGIIGMQLIQNKPGFLNINVLPADNFEPESMNDVLKLSKDYLGDMGITWEIVDELERTDAGKVKYVIRRF